MFRLERVSKTYDGETPALGPLTLELEPDTTTALIGPSGCGKSTLLKLLIGLVAPDSGSISFDGRPLQAATLQQLRQSVGYVIQEGGLFPHLSARGNIVLMAEHLGWPPRRIDARLDELVALTHFPGSALDRFPLELSGGQNQRVALMRALMLDPRALLLDEPLGALDPMIRFELQADLARIFHELGKTVVLVTHDLAEAAYLGDRVVLLRDGRIVQQGSLRDLLDAPCDEFVRRFTRAQRSHLSDSGAPS
jgi:osmoprotectant transport system ATP-binding protein